LSDRRFCPRLFLFISFLNFFWRLWMRGMVPNLWITLVSLFLAGLRRLNYLV
jgi:hypothetical protein